MLTAFVAVGLSTGVLVDLAERLFGADPGAIARALGTAAIVLGTWTIARLIDAIVWQALLPRRSGHASPRLAHTMTTVLALTTGAVIASTVHYEGVSATLLTTSSVVLAIIGFAIRGVIADIFYGVVIAFEQPFQINDWLRMPDGRDGLVIEMGWWSTRLLTREEFTLIVPNSRLASGLFLNLSKPQPFLRASTRVRFSEDIDPDQAERILISAAKAVDASAKLPREPEARITDISADGIEFELCFWTPDRLARGDVRMEIQKNILRNIRVAGLRLPRRPRETWVGEINADRAAMTEATLDWLSAIAVFAPLSQDERQALADQAARTHLAPGAELLKEGAAGDSLFVVLEGVLEATVQHAERQPTMLGRLKAGDVIGEMSLLTGEARSATVTAITSAVLMRIDRQALQPVLKALPDAAEAIAVVVASRRQAGDDAINSNIEQDSHSDWRDDLLGRMRSIFRIA
jgi:small-conductance mechanosensitive channel